MGEHEKWLICIMSFLILLTCTNCSKSENRSIERPHSPEQIIAQSPVIIKSEMPRVDLRSQIPKKSAAYGIVPTRLYIPEAGINAEVEPVHVSDKGQMGVLLDIKRVGYLSSGVLPRAVGNAVWMDM